MKYILFRKPDGLMESVLFLCPMSHERMAQIMEICGWVPVRAGFWDPLTGGTYGQSDSLKLPSDPRDGQTIRTLCTATAQAATRAGYVAPTRDQWAA